MGTTIKVPNREIAIRAFDYLRHERKTDSALRLAHHLLHYDRIFTRHRRSGLGDRYGYPKVRRQSPNRIPIYGTFQFQRRDGDGEREIRRDIQR